MADRIGQRGRSGTRRAWAIRVCAIVAMAMAADRSGGWVGPPAAPSPVIAPDGDGAKGKDGGEEGKGGETRAEAKARHEREFLAAYKAKDWEAAQDALLKWIAIDGQNFVPYYNLACVLAQREEIGQAERMLESAVMRGFADRVRLTSDPDLEPLRKTETYLAIIEGWERIVTAQVERRLVEARKQFRPVGEGGLYVYERDESGRLAYISAFEAASFAQAKEQLRVLSGWWETEILPDKADEPWRTGKLPAAEPWVMVILPTRQDFRIWVTREYGAAGWERIGGEYSHDQRRLIAMDLGSTLRHEFWHVLHWRHMERLGQRHPAWVMEGLCSMVEDAEAGPKGEMRLLPSWRTNMTKRALKVGTIMPLETLLSLEQGTFVGNRPLAQYAHARALFMYLHAEGKLRAWYTAYVKGFRQDATGRMAMEETFGKPIKEVDRSFRAWLKTVPEVAVEIRPGMANLPFDVDAGMGDGIVVASIPGSKGNGIRARDVLTAIDGKPVHDLYDYMRILSALTPGAEVEVEFRRPVRGKPTEGAAERNVAKVRLIRQPG